MYSLNIEYLENQSVTLIMSGNIRKLGQYQGKQELLFHQRPQLIKTLKEIAIIQSTESSNRIEGIIVPSKRLEAILKNKSTPKNRPEGQVLGYRNVLAKIHSSFEQIEISPEAILDMHREILQFTDLPKGEWITRFSPTPARETPFYMKELCDQFHRLWNNDQIDRLLLIFAFVFDFLCIHPFSDGNGRISRLLTVLLLHKIHFDVTRYISFERLVEETKETYYEVLRKCSEGWHERQHRLSPWFEYHVSMLLSAYQELEERVSVVTGRGEKSAWVREMVDQLPDEFQIGDLTRKCPGVSRPMVRHILETLREEGKLEVIGVGRGARWRKKNLE